MPGQTTKTALTEEFMFQNVVYRPTVYITGVYTLASTRSSARKIPYKRKDPIWLFTQRSISAMTSQAHVPGKERVVREL